MANTSYAKKKEESDKKIQAALEARSKRTSPASGSLSAKNEASNSKIQAALEARNTRVQSSLPDIFSDIQKNLTVEIDSYNNTKPAFGLYDDTYKSQRDRRLSISKLRSKVEAYRGYMDDGVPDRILSSLEQMEQGYDAYLSMSKFDSEEAYEKAVRESGYYQEYGNLGYEEIKDKLFVMPKGTEEYEWLSAYAPTVMKAEDYDKEISSVEGELTNLEAVLEEYNRLVKGVSTSNPNAYANTRLAELRKQYGSEKDIETKIEEIKATKWEYENRKKYSFLENNTDFQEKSTANPDEKGDPTYAYINDIDGTRASYYGRSLNVGNPYYKYDYMTDEEIARYNYLHAVDTKAADEYLEYLGYTLDERRTNNAKDTVAKTADEYPVFMSAISVPANLMSGIGLVDIAGQNAIKGIKETVTGEYAGPINYNSAAMGANTLTTTVRGTVSQNIANKYGVIEINEDKHPLWSKILNGKSFGDVYQLGMSMADSAAVAVLSPVLGSYGTVLLGGSAGTQGVLNAVANGATDEQALAMGVTSGIFEMLFEKYSLETLLTKNGKKFIDKALRQALAEGSEEFFTSAANNITEILVMAEKSGYIKPYLDAGLNEGEALHKALLDMGIDMGWDFVGGMISGGIMGSASALIMKRIDAKQNYEESKVNQGILQLIDRVKQGNYSGNDKVYLNNISEVAASRIQELTGIDTRGYKVAIEARQIEHILKDHGENGITDRSMANSTDIAKMEYVLENPDAINKAGTTRAYVTNKNGKMKPADTVLYEKQNGDGSYYVVQAVPDTKKKTLYVVTAFIGKSGYKNMEAPQSTNAKGPGVTPKAESAVASNNSISQTTPGVNNETVLQSTGEVVNFEKFTKVENGKAIVLANGKKVDAADVSLGDEGTDLVFHSVIGFDNMTASGANAIMQAYKKGGVSAGAFGQGAAVAYRWGYHGYSEVELAKQKYAGKLTEVQRDVIYQAGREAGIAATEADQNRVDSIYAEAQEILEQKGVEKTHKHRAVLEDGITLDSLSESQRVSFDLADKVAQAAKVGVRVYIGEPGEFGYYDHNSDTVCLNLNAKNKSRVSMMAFTLGHELVHRAKQGSPKKYKAFADFLVQEYGKQGVSMEELIAEQIAAAKRHNVELSEDKAFEEVVCDACQRMLLDTNAGQKLAEFGAQSEQNKGILNELKRWISQFMDRLRKVFKGVDPDSMAAKEFAKFDKTVQQTLADMFVDMTIDAGEKLSTIQNAYGDSKANEKSYKFAVSEQAYKEPAYHEWEVQEALYDVLDHADKGRDNLIRVGDMPRFVADELGVEGVFYIYRNHAYENMATADQAKLEGRFNTKAHYHGLGIETMTDAIMALEEPLMTIATKTKGGNPAVIMLLSVEGNNKAPLYAVLSFYSSKDINGDYSRKPHIVLTIAERSAIEDGGRTGLADVINSAVSENRVVSFNKNMRDYLTVKTKATSLGIISEKSLTDNLAQFRKEIKAFREKNNIDYKLSTGEDMSPRALLANALESVAQNESENYWIKQYREKISQLNEQEQKLHEQRAQIRKLSFAKGKRDTAKIKELQLEAVKTENRINILDKQLLRIEAAKPLRELLESEKAKAKKRAEQKAKRDLEAYRKAERERSEKREKEIREGYQESRKKATESRHRTEMRHKIQGFKKRLVTMLQSPTDRQYVPIDLINAMVDVCVLIDTDTNLYKADGSINKAQERRNLTKEKLQNLKDEYEKLKVHSDPIYAGEFDEMVYAYLTRLRDEYSGKHLNDMSLDELTGMYEILISIEETLRDARKLIGWGDAEGVYEAGDAIVAEQKKITQKRKNGKRNATQKSIDAIDNLSLSPVRNVERMSGYNQDSRLLKMFKKFEQGIRKKNKFVMEAYKSFESLTSSKEYDDAVYKEVGGRKYTDVKGRKFGVSKMQMMQAILSWERELANKNLHHIEKGGFTFADLDKLRKGNLKDAVSAESSHRVPAAEGLVAEFQEILENDEWCQDYMATARKFFNETAKDAINETSIALKHRIIAKDKSYIPFEVDTNFVNTEITDMDAVQKTINSYGMLEATKNNAPQALYITGLNNILDRHIEQVGNVYGLAIEVRNFNKVWNVRTKDESGSNPTVKESIDTNWGKDGVKHIEQAVKDIQGTRVRERSALYDKVKSGYISSIFLLNLSVVTKQVGSLFSATAMLRWRSPARMIGNLFHTMIHHKKISAEVDKYTASAWMRRKGLSDAEIHALVTEGKKSWLGRVMVKAPAIINPTKWISAMDHAVALSLWKYAKIDTAKRTGLTGEELLKTAAEFYDEVVENTQSMTDILHRPEIQKKGNVISESLAMFKTDLYQMAGQLQTTLGRFTSNKTKENGRMLARTVYSVAMSAVWSQLMTTVFALLRYKVNPYRDDEDEELTARSWLKRQGFAFCGDLVGYIFPLFGSEFVGVIENIMYGESDDVVDNLSITAINDLYNVMITVATAIKDKEIPEITDCRKIAAKALQVFGIPVNNILRALDAVHLHAKDIANGEPFSFEAGVDRTPANHIHRIMEALEAGNEDVAAGLYEEAVEELAMRKSKDGSCGEDELKAATSDLKSALGKKYQDGKISKKTTSKMLSELFGDSSEEVNGKISYWDFKIENPDSDIPSQWFNTYYEKVENYDVDLDVYIKYRTRRKNITERDEILKAINAVPISNRQKDALYFAEGYAESKLSEAPWH